MFKGLGLPVIAGQAVLNDSNTASRSCGLRQKLQRHWEDLSALIVHDHLPAIRFDKDICKKMHKPSKCFLSRLCICGKGPRENTYTTWIVGRLIKAMKQVFWSQGTGKERKTSSPRQLLENAHVVVALRERDSEAAGVWLHVGFVNYKTWAMSTFEFTCVRLDPGVRRAWLRLIDVEASDIAYVVQQIDDSGEDTELHELGLQVRTMLEAVKAKVDFQQACTASFWRFATDVLPDTPLLEEMLPCFLQVVPLHEAPDVVVWEGSAVEDAPKPPGGSQVMLSSFLFENDSRLYTLLVL